MTPHPQAYALYADKRRLVDLTNTALLEQLGVDAQTRALLARYVPITRLVEPADAEQLWQDRRNLFFKPASGFGSRGAYRGEKLTKRVWADILDANYVAQALVSPGERRTVADHQVRPMKFDLRAYAYAGTVQWMAARLYQGQTTNFRTDGGGFAPVFTLNPDEEAADAGKGSTHASYTFLLDDTGHIEPLPHPLYVALVSAQSAIAALAGKRFRLADWYVAVDAGRPTRVVREWYGWVTFDADGKFRPESDSHNPTASGTGNVDTTVLPSPLEHDRITTLLHGGE